MTDDVWQRDEIESPCVRVCVIDQRSSLCLGCYRNAAEIRSWGQFSTAERRRVMAALPDRAANVAPKRRGGRAGRHNSLTNKKP